MGKMSGLHSVILERILRILSKKNINWGSWKIGKHSMDSWGFKKKKVWVIGGEHNLMQKSNENM